MEIYKTAVIGAGIMGSGIAQVLAINGCDVKLHDIEPERCDRAMDRIENGRFGMAASVERGKLSGDELNKARKRIQCTSDLEVACKDTQLVIEAIPEDLGLKLELFKWLDKLTNPDTILASNTGGLPITALAHATDSPGRVLGWHWAQPTVVIRLAEIITHPKTEPEVVKQVEQLARRCGKNPVVIRDNPLSWGFVVNRIMRVIRLEADRIVEEKVATPDQVDTLMKDCFRWPMGPFENREQTTYE